MVKRRRHTQAKSLDGNDGKVRRAFQDITNLGAVDCDDGDVVSENELENALSKIQKAIDKKRPLIGTFKHEGS